MNTFDWKKYYGEDTIKRIEYILAYITRIYIRMGR